MINTLRPRQNRRHFADDIFKCIFLNENARISLKISLKFVPMVRINNIPALVQIMAWRRLGAKPLSEPMMVSLLTHICITRPQWVKAEYISNLDLTTESPYFTFQARHRLSYIISILETALYFSGQEGHTHQQPCYWLRNAVYHDNCGTWKHVTLCMTGPLWGESIDQQWIDGLVLSGNKLLTEPVNGLVHQATSH